jgi:hypothetical protein
VILRQPPIGYQQVQCGKSASAGYDFILAGFPALLCLLSHEQIVDQSLRCDQGSQFPEAGSLFLADIQGRENEVFDRSADGDGFNSLSSSAASMASTASMVFMCFVSMMNK